MKERTIDRTFQNDPPDKLIYTFNFNPKVKLRLQVTESRELVSPILIRNFTIKSGNMILTSTIQPKAYAERSCGERL